MCESRILGTRVPSAEASASAHLWPSPVPAVELSHYSHAFSVNSNTPHAVAKGRFPSTQFITAYILAFCLLQHAVSSACLLAFVTYSLAYLSCVSCVNEYARGPCVVSFAFGGEQA